eukprot:4341877-Prymnesium_polylepis.1
MVLLGWGSASRRAPTWTARAPTRTACAASVTASAPSGWRGGRGAASALCDACGGGAPPTNPPPPRAPRPGALSCHRQCHRRCP